MAKTKTIQTVKCMVNIGGDLRHSVLRDSRVDKIETTYPEVLLLRMIHGEQGVTDIEPVGEIERSKGEEKERLIRLYSPGYVNQLYQGHEGGNMPTHMPGFQTELSDEDLLKIDRAKKYQARAAAQSIEVER